MLKRSIRVSYDDILNKLYNKFDNNIIMLTSKIEYLGTHYKSKFKCNKCGRIFELSINKILTTDNGCSMCSKKMISNENLNLKLKDKNIIILNSFEYYVLDRKYNFKCKDCEFQWNTTVRNIINGKKCCPKCTKHMHYDIEDIKKELQKNQNGKIKIVESTYRLISKKSKFICIVCDNTWDVKCSNVITGETGCPRCQFSKGERKIEVFLVSKNIKFESQKIFDNCKNKRHLLFDFYLPDYNICIEFDGKQHFIPYNNTKNKKDLSYNDKNLKKFNDIVKNDRIKDDFCLNNNINLIRIKYTDIDKTNEILKNKLSKL